MRKITLLFSLLLSSFLCASAQEWKAIYGNVANAVTGEVLSQVRVELLNTDSIPVDTCLTSKGKSYNDVHMVWAFSFYDFNKNYILRISKEGYETKYVNINTNFKKREKIKYVEQIKLKKIPKTYTLNGAVVKATRVKVYTKGDTLVYNADAFQMAEGSMLDALLKQMPGVELKDDGRILVNGKFVENLTLNGQNFFNGDNSVMLENLPSYAVKDIKVFDKKSDKSEFAGRDFLDHTYTMDVTLKKEYSIGWIGNAEGGAGSKDRYMSRLFAMRYTPQSRITFYGFMNNLNDKRKPGENSEWTPSDMTGGLEASKRAGLDYNISDKHNRYNLEGNAQISHYDKDFSSTSNTTNFLPSGNTFEKSHDQAYSCHTDISQNNMWTFIWKNYQLRVSPSISYSRWRNSYAYQSATMSENLNESYGASLLDSIFAPGSSSLLRSKLINTVKQESRTKGHEVKAELYVTNWIKFKGSEDFLEINLVGNMSNKKEENFSHYLLKYPSNQSAATDFRNRYNNTSPNNSYDYKANARYFYAFNGKINLAPRYEYSYHHSALDKGVYRLERIEGWEETTDKPIGSLPSSSEAMLFAMDTQNSYWSQADDYKHNVGAYFSWMEKEGAETYKANSWFNIDLAMSMIKNKLNYTRANQNKLISRNSTFLNASLLYYNFWRNKKKTKRSIEARYSHNGTTPNMTYLVDIVNDYNPLYITRGNANLENTHSHSASVNYQNRQTEKQRYLSVILAYNATQNKVVMGYIYDKQTGVRTSMPDNVNGDYSIQGRLNYTLPIDKAKRLTLSSATSADFYNSVDLIGLEGEERASRSVVKSLYMGETIKLNYKIKKTTLGAKVGGTWVRSTSKREDFTTINAADINYALTAVCELPLGLQIGTDLTMYSRYGYDDPEMNTNELIWNARISKKILKNKLTIAIDGFDILGNLSSVSRTINAQGRTETYRNVIPSYVMLHAIYRLNIKPKKKSGE